jgi:SurA N-terminal domain
MAGGATRGRAPSTATAIVRSAARFTGVPPPGGVCQARGWRSGIASWLVRKRLLALILVVLGLSACGSPPAGVAVSVNGADMPSHLYDVIVRSSALRSERQGLQVDVRTALGARRVRLIESRAIEQLVRDAVLDQLAAKRRIGVGQADLQTTIHVIEHGLGGAAVLDQQLALDEMTRNDLQALLRFTVLEQRLSLADSRGFPAALQEALRQAKVQAYVGPCASNHQYPQCLPSG